MATPNPIVPIPGSKLKIYTGDGATPEVFTFACALTTKNWSRGTATEEDLSFDCANPDDMPLQVSTVKYLTNNISGSGLAAFGMPSYARMEDAYRTGSNLNMQIKIDLPGAQGGFTMQSTFIVAKLDILSSENGTIKFNAEFKNVAKPVYTANP